MPWRLMLFGAALAILALLRPVKADAAQPGCPISATGFLAANSQHTTFGFRLSFSSPHLKPAAGQVAFDTNRGWFRLAFPGPGLFYARFPEPVMIRNAWVENEDNVACYPPASNWQQFSSAERSQLSRAPAARDIVLQAKIREPYGRTNCSQPFEPVHAVTVVEPDFSPKQATFPGTAQIEVTVMPDGKVADAAIVAGSGTADFDDAALEAARKSTYTPALAYCLPTAARYLYKAAIHP